MMKSDIKDFSMEEIIKFHSNTLSRKIFIKIWCLFIIIFFKLNLGISYNISKRTFNNFLNLKFKIAEYERFPKNYFMEVYHQVITNPKRDTLYLLLENYMVKESGGTKSQYIKEKSLLFIASPVYDTITYLEGFIDVSNRF